MSVGSRVTICQTIGMDLEKLGSFCTYTTTDCSKIFFSYHKDCAPLALARRPRGVRSGPTANESTVRRTLEAAGVEFIDENGGGPGVRACESHLNTGSANKVRASSRWNARLSGVNAAFRQEARPAITTSNFGDRTPMRSCAEASPFMRPLWPRRESGIGAALVHKLCSSIIPAS